ncbi:efflux RND transporter periplasmic adaptor subunit [Roseomonas populi]|uniref:Efflux RND transporter periplasmic adaptor subunit n=1 Tax=Roseomonas populi TaxID=3121582 RepID=A0ABT1X802_9PROT|nr:efflux RND transporter periplasmic adaptor subunit [Roseomonas pecuniae]MCR0984238.1 efflux RND transporter periplasmic adaptor subunit [Roseomonas pecuniae]
MMRRTPPAPTSRDRAARTALLRAAPLLALLASATPALAQFGPQGPPAVGIMEAARRPVTESTDFVGRVEALEHVDIIARVTGYLQERLFQEGQEVKKGDPLYRIERQTFEADLARAQATVASAEAELANARVSLSRAQELSRTGAGTRVSLDNAVAQERTANAQLLSARAAARAAEINLGYTEITSPIDGKIGRTNLTIGNVVGPNAGALATIVSVDPMRVSFPISQRQALELRDRYAGRGGVDAVVIRFRTVDGKTYPQPGRIEFIDNQINRNTDSILVRARVPNPPNGPGGDRQLIDGQFVNVSVEGAEPVQAITIPRAAVLQDQQGTYAFIVDAENKAQRRNLRLGRSTPQTAVIEEGLNPGDKVIVEGIQRVRPGQEVNAAPAGPAPGAPAQGQGGSAAPAASGSTPAGNAAAGNSPASAAPGRANQGTTQGAPAGAGASPPGAPAAPSTGQPGTTQPQAANPPANQSGTAR